MRTDQAVRLKQGRQQAKLTQKQAAKALNVALSTYKDWEKPGGSEPATISKIIEIANLYNLSLDWWLTDKEFSTTTEETEQSLIKLYKALPAEAQKGLIELLKQTK